MPRCAPAARDGAITYCRSHTMRHWTLHIPVLCRPTGHALFGAIGGLARAHRRATAVMLALCVGCAAPHEPERSRAALGGDRQPSGAVSLAAGDPADPPRLGDFVLYAERSLTLGGFDLVEGAAIGV